MQLTENFSLEEFAVSDSYPFLVNQIAFDDFETFKIFTLCKTLLQPVREHFNTSMLITSGKRTETLNSLIKGSTTSQHLLAEAVDWRFSPHNTKELLEAYSFIHNSLHRNYHQLILYLTKNYTPRFIHMSINSLKTQKPQVTLVHHDDIYVPRKRFNFSFLRAPS